MLTYDEIFYANLAKGSRNSAREIVPFILDLISCHSVIDVGCGTGEWLSVFKECGVSQILGLDGEYVVAEQLSIPKDQFRAVDLVAELNIQKKFDLAMSLEVAEHLPETCSDQFVESLTRLSSVVLFSASIPHQEGTNHINEQWNDYWVVKFKERGYEVIDCLREAFWQNENVEWWYKQNLLLFVKGSELPNFPKLLAQYRENLTPPQLVHPAIFLYQVRKNQEKEQILNRRIIKAALTVDNFLRRNVKKLIGRNG